MAWPFKTFTSLNKLQEHFLGHHQVLVLATPDSTWLSILAPGKRPLSSTNKAHLTTYNATDRGNLIPQGDGVYSRSQDIPYFHQGRLPSQLRLGKRRNAAEKLIYRVSSDNSPHPRENSKTMQSVNTLNIGMNKRGRATTRPISQARPTVASVPICEQ